MLYLTNWQYRVAMHGMMGIVTLLASFSPPSHLMVRNAKCSIPA
jgi:hypothetical protein